MTPTECLSQPYKHFLIHDSEAGGYTAGIEEFPGCVAEGETPQEALENLERNALAWLEVELEAGRPIPPPSIFEEPPSSKRLSLRLPPAIHHSAAEWAKDNNTSLNSTVVTAVAYFLGAKDALEAFASSQVYARVESLPVRVMSAHTLEHVYDGQDVVPYYMFDPESAFAGSPFELYDKGIIKIGTQDAVWAVSDAEPADDNRN